MPLTFWFIDAFFIILYLLMFISIIPDCYYDEITIAYIVAYTSGLFINLLIKLFDLD